MKDTTSEYLQAVLDKDSVRAQSVIASVAGDSQNLVNMFEVLGNAQVEIGSLWEKNVISVADEHYATQVALDVISAVSNRFRQSSKRLGYAALFSCAGEFHNVGLRMFSTLLSFQGWTVDFLGVGLTVSQVLDALKKKGRKPDLVCVSITMDFNMQGLLETLRELRRNPDFKETKIMVGGRLFESKTLRASLDEIVGGHRLADSVTLDIKSGLDYASSLLPLGKRE